MRKKIKNFFNRINLFKRISDLEREHADLLSNYYSLESINNRLNNEVRKQGELITQLVADISKCVNINEPVKLTETIHPDGTRRLTFEKDESITMNRYFDISGTMGY